MQQIRSLGLALVSAIAAAMVMELFGVTHVYGIVDQECIWAHQSIQSHPCNCFTGSGSHHFDMCYRATYLANSPDNTQNEAMTTGCNRQPELNCAAVPAETAFDCGASPFFHQR